MVLKPFQHNTALLTLMSLTKPAPFVFFKGGSQRKRNLRNYTVGHDRRFLAMLRFAFILHP